MSHSFASFHVTICTSYENVYTYLFSFLYTRWYVYLIFIYTYGGMPIIYTIYPMGYIFKDKYMYTYSYLIVKLDKIDNYYFY